MRRSALLILLCLAVVFYSCDSRAGEVRISFVGDIIMHIPVKNSVQYRNIHNAEGTASLNNRGFDFLFERVRDDLQGSDVVVGNMEFPIAPPFSSKPRIFNCRPEILPAMKKAGFTMMHIANNHILDQADRGVVTTMGFIRNSGMDYLGVGENEPAARAGLMKTVRGIRIGFLGYTGLLNYHRPRRPSGYYLNWFYDRGKVIADIEAMKKRADFIVMVVHAGVEYDRVPSNRDVKLMREYIDHGVDLVIGHHSHVIQPVERVLAKDGRVSFIFYSLGNFVSNQNPTPALMIDGYPITPRDAIIVHCMLRGNGPGERPDAVFNVVPVHTVNERERDTGLRVIQAVAIDRHIEMLKKELSGSTAKEKVDIERRIQNLYQKITTIKRALFGKKSYGEIRYRHGYGGYGR
ncbi:MAG: CapA family protein [Spirochaetes bacterium]|nr:CapA family protein [Spirochaetota bacterium]